MNLPHEIVSAISNSLLATHKFSENGVKLVFSALESIQNAHIVTVRDVYGTDEPKIPDGYERVDFRPYVIGDTRLAIESNQAQSCYNNCVAFLPHIILRRRKVTRKQWVLTETGEKRKVLLGEWYCSDNGNMKWPHDFPSKHDYSILHCEEREIEVTK